MLTLLACCLALAGPPPCEDLTRPDTLEGEHFWIEWDPAVGDLEIAQQNLDWAEEARRVYTDELGYDFTSNTILIRLEESPTSSGLTTTVACDDGTLAPHITLFARQPGEPGQNTTMHEVVHAVQYAYMGSYIDSINAWPWWMEGHATWLTFLADGAIYERTAPASGYLDAPWVGLHQTPFAYADPVTSRFLYGTSLLVDHLSRTHGPEAVRATWEFGGPLTGSQILISDALADQGIDFHDFWLGFLAETAVLDVPDADWISDPLLVEERVTDLPAWGEPSEETRPQGYGVSTVLFKKGAGSPGRALTVSIEADPDVDWLAVLVRAKGRNPGGRVVDTVELVIRPDGSGTASLPDFDGSNDAYLVVSPIDPALEGHAFSWEADLTIPQEEEQKKGCGCESAPGSTGWLGLLLALGFARLRRTAQD